MKKHLLILMSLLISLSTQSALHPVPHYDHNPMPPCACKPYFNLRDKAITQENLAKWSEYAMLSLYSFGFGNYEASFKQASHFFTPEGWQDIQSAFEASGNVDTVVEKKLLVSAEVIEPAFLIRQVNDTEWLYQLKLAVSYDNAERRLNQILKIHLHLKQYKPIARVDSVGISMLNAEVEEN